MKCLKVMAIAGHTSFRYVVPLFFEKNEFWYVQKPTDQWKESHLRESSVFKNYWLTILVADKLRAPRPFCSELPLLSDLLQTDNEFDLQPSWYYNQSSVTNCQNFWNQSNCQIVAGMSKPVYLKTYLMIFSKVNRPS